MYILRSSCLKLRPSTIRTKNSIANKKKNIVVSKNEQILMGLLFVKNLYYLFTNHAFAQLRIVAMFHLAVVNWIG